MSTPTQNTATPPAFFDGQRLRSLRRERGISVRKLAKQADLCARQIWRMEGGHRPNVRAITLAQVASVLGTSIDYLMGLTDTVDPYDGTAQVVDSTAQPTTPQEQTQHHS